MGLIKPAVFDIGGDLVGVGIAPALFIAVRAAKADQGANARAADVVLDIVGVVFELGAAIGIDHRGQPQPCAQV